MLAFGVCLPVSLLNRATVRLVGFPGFRLISCLGLCFLAIGQVFSLGRASAYEIALVRPFDLVSSLLGSKAGLLPFLVLRPVIRLQLEIRISALLR